jgi:hypothetical protein
LSPSLALATLAARSGLAISTCPRGEAAGERCSTIMPGQLTIPNLVPDADPLRCDPLRCSSQQPVLQQRTDQQSCGRQIGRVKAAGMAVGQLRSYAPMTARWQSVSSSAGAHAMIASGSQRCCCHSARTARAGSLQRCRSSRSPRPSGPEFVRQLTSKTPGSTRIALLSANATLNSLLRCRMRPRLM